MRASRRRFDGRAAAHRDGRAALARASSARCL